jgi:threonine 3-dehydrogenase
MACKIASVAGALSVIAIDPQEHKRTWRKTSEHLLRSTRMKTGGSSGCWRIRVNRVAWMLSWRCRAVVPVFETLRVGPAGWGSGFAGNPAGDVTLNLSESIIFKSVTVRGINGRLMFETWYQCEQFLLERKLDLRPLIPTSSPTAISRRRSRSSSAGKRQSHPRLDRLTV